MDVLSLEQRRLTMAAVKSRNTKPELSVRSLLHSLGYRFRLHRKDLVGQPDVVLPKYKTVLFVHGCFWHQHPHCKHAARPVSRQEYWDAKLNRNIERDKSQQAELQTLGWQVIVVWECEIRNADQLKQRFRHLLTSTR